VNEATLEAVAEKIGKKAASDVLHEAVAEVGGRSSRRWAVKLVALLLVGGVIALVVAARRTRQAAAPDDQQQVSPAQTLSTAAPAASQARSS
jgi:hypothetical protein